MGRWTGGKEQLVPYQGEGGDVHATCPRFRAGIYSHMTFSPRVCVVVPVYRSELTPTERISLTQCRRVLGHHPFRFVAPDDLQLPYRITGEVVERFPSEFFSGVEAYNRLMLSDQFYERFGDFDFILIHQLDAFVFRDELLEWCRRGFDYVGAPWFIDSPVTLSPWLRFGQWMTRLRGLRQADGTVPWIMVEFAGGNGGLSLRRVSAMRRALALDSQRVETYRRGGRPPLRNEDVYFTVEANHGRIRPVVRVAPFPVALQFSMESDPETAFQLSGYLLPFGCHAWDRFQPEFWRPHISACGYSLSDLP